MGRPATEADLAANMTQQGDVRFEKVHTAAWEVDLSGMLNLDHPRAKAAGLKDRKEPIGIFFYVIEHPTRGTYLIDTGVAESFAIGGDKAPVGWLVRNAMGLDALTVHKSTKAWLAEHPRRVSGIFLTHLHLDHIMGLEDFPRSTPLYVGPSETRDSKFLYLFARSTTEQNLNGFDALHEFRTSPAGDGGIVDIFGDGSVYGLHRPGHTSGSMAYVVRAVDGNHLIAGDCSHTAWGWENDVEPGSFNTDGAQAARSLAQLRRFAAAHPNLNVHLGHQPLSSR